MLLLLTIFVYFGLFYFQIVKRFWGKSIYKNVLKPFGAFIRRLTSSKLSKVIMALLLVGVFALYLGLETRDNPSRLRPLLGIAVLLSIGFIFSKNIRQVTHENYLLTFLPILFKFLLLLISDKVATCYLWVCISISTWNIMYTMGNRSSYI